VQLKNFLFLFLFPLPLLAFEVDPWFSPIAELQFRPSYSYRFYPSVDQAVNPSHYSSHDHILDLNLGVSFLPHWDAQLELDFSNTRKVSWGAQRAGLQLRYLWLDDVAGDIVSLTTGLVYFYVPTRNMRDVSSPYHATSNFELGIAAGKEIDKIYDWIFRFYGFVGVGIANRGSPWVRPLLSFESKFKKKHKVQLFSEGYFGLAHRQKVNINRFSGYGKIHHQSVDIGANYNYHFDIWGSITLQYSYRIFAKAFPRHASTFTLKYTLPFSVF